MRCLYITYDGLTDNLGGSQILPYLYGLAAGGHKITILSCEKRENLEQRGESVERELAARGLSWSRLTYHKKPPVLSTVWDVARMAWRAQALNRREAFDLVHVRSYVPALVGSFLQRVWGLKLLFDMRGFWADERVDGGLWDLRKPVYRMVYRFFKRVEKQALKRSDAVISLTQAGCEELLRWPVAASSGLAARLSVIPCCVDLELFSTGASRSALRGINRESLGIEADDIVCGYLGSIGTWYCLEEMMQFFRLARERGHADRFLFVTSEPSAQILAAAQRAGVPFGAVSVVASRREDVPAWLSLMDYGVFFIRPCYSKISSSATKLGELMAAGLPVISNQGVGDQTAIFSRNRIGHLVRDFGKEELTTAADGVPAILQMPRDGIRRAAETEFSLERGVLQYQKIYEDITRATAALRS